MSRKLFSITFALIFCIAAAATTVVAAPLPDGTLLSIITGTGSAINNPCPGGGSCFSMEAAPGTDTWTDFGPGTDGGIIIGKDQACGGQELSGGGTVTTPGEVSSFWSYFSNNGTFGTAPYPASGFPIGASANLFDDAGCTLGGCIGKTELNAWYVCWNAGVYPMGSGYQCDPVVTPSCTVDQVNGISLDYYTIDPVDGDWSIYHRWVVPSGGFQNVRFGVIMRGTGIITCADAATRCDDNDACTDDTCDPATSVCSHDAISCDDNNVCTDDAACDPVDGCVHTNNTLTMCDDGNACTTGDVCSDGVCLGATVPLVPLSLVSPTDDQTGLGTTVEFRWRKAEGAVSYDFSNCADDETASCDSETVSAQLNSKGIFYAGGAGLFLIGMTFISGLRGRTRIVLLLVIVALLTGGMLTACPPPCDNGDCPPLPPPADEVQHFATGLSSNTTYYWKVVAIDGFGCTNSSEVWSFTTL